MPFVIKKVSHHGTSNPIVARLAVQTSEVIRIFSLPKEKQDRVLEIYINMVKPRLLRDNITKENEAIKGASTQMKFEFSPTGGSSKCLKSLASPNKWRRNARSALRDLGDC
jgi:hypothetical protein